MNATISHCGKFRYSLTRGWIGGVGICVFIMLNPSTADAMIDDPTILRCIAFGQAWGYAAIEVVNLYAFRATKPKVMFAADDPVGPENDAYILAAAARGDLLVAAWGANARHDRVNAVRELLRPYMVHALGFTKEGHPRHPLFMRGDSKPVQCDWKSAA